MNGYAVIKLVGDETNNSLRLDWNGGRGAVAAFIEEAVRRLNKNQIVPENVSDDGKFIYQADFYSLLYGAAREFFCYYLKNKDRDTGSVGMATFSNSAVKPDDNLYIIHNDFSCPRAIKAGFSEWDQENYQAISDFFALIHNTLSAIDGAHTMTYAQSERTLPELNTQFHLARNASTYFAKAARRISELGVKQGEAAS